MALRKLDRYVSHLFLVPFLGSVAVVFGLYVSYDLLKRVDMFQEQELRDAVPAMLSYYGYVFPVVMVDLAPPLVLVAASLVLIRMARQRELLVIKAAGTSVHRTLAPIFFWTLLIAAGVVAVRETVVPRVARRKAMMDERFDAEIGRRLLLEDRKERFTLFISRHDFSTGDMKLVTIITWFPEGTIRMHLQADRGRLEDGYIELETVVIRQFSPESAPVGPPAPSASYRLKSSLTPFDLVRADREEKSSKSLVFTLPELLEKARDNPSIPQFRVTLHSRLASALTPFVLLLVGMPLLVGFEETMKSRFLGVMLAILLAGTYYILSFVFISMGNTGAVSPAVAGWMPVLVVGLAGLWLFESMHT